MKMTTFADAADVAAFRRCKAHGGTDHACFKVGDNAVGFWGDDTSEGSGPSVAVIPDDMRDKWGSVDAAHMKIVYVEVGDYGAYARVKDTMPPRSYQAAHNGSQLDLNPDLCALLNLTPGVDIDGTWRWCEGNEGMDSV